jgi:hypothetical protein
MTFGDVMDVDGWAREGEEGSWEALLRRLRVVGSWDYEGLHSVARVRMTKRGV